MNRPGYCSAATWSPAPVAPPSESVALCRVQAAPGTQATFTQPLAMFSPLGDFAGVCVLRHEHVHPGSWTCLRPTGAPCPNWEAAIGRGRPQRSPPISVDASSRIRPTRPFFDNVAH